MHSVLSIYGGSHRSQDPTGTNWVTVQVAGVKMVQTFHKIIYTNPAVHHIGGAGGHTRQALTLHH